MVCFVLPLYAFLFYCPFAILTTRGTTNALSSFKLFAGDGNTTPRAADKRVTKHQHSADEIRLHIRKQFWYTGARQAEGYGNRLSYKLTTQSGVTECWNFERYGPWEMIQYVLRVTSFVILNRPSLFTVSENGTSVETVAYITLLFL